MLGLVLWHCPTLPTLHCTWPRATSPSWPGTWLCSLLPFKESFPLRSGRGQPTILSDFSHPWYLIFMLLSFCHEASNTGALKSVERKLSPTNYEFAIFACCLTLLVLIFLVWTQGYFLCLRYLEDSVDNLLLEGTKRISRSHFRILEHTKHTKQAAWGILEKVAQWALARIHAGLPSTELRACLLAECHIPCQTFG